MDEWTNKWAQTRKQHTISKWQGVSEWVCVWYVCMLVLQAINESQLYSWGNLASSIHKTGSPPTLPHNRVLVLVEVMAIYTHLFQLCTWAHVCLSVCVCVCVWVCVCVCELTSEQSVQNRWWEWGWESPSRMRGPEGTSGVWSVKINSVEVILWNH